MSTYDMREGQCGTADAWTKLTGTGKADNAGDIMVPSGVSRITRIISIVAPGTTAGAATYLMALEGGGLQQGRQEFTIASTTHGAGTITCNLVKPCLVKNTDIPVQPGNQISVYGCMSGADQGTPEMAICLEFS